MTTTLRIATPQEIAQWDACLLGLPNAHFLQSQTWAAFKSAHGWTPHFIMESGTNTPILGMERRMPGLPVRQLYFPKGPAWDPIKSSPAWNERLAAITDFAQNQLGCQWVKIETEVPEDHAVSNEGYRAKGFSQALSQPQFRKTLLIDLAQTEETLLKSFKPKTRYNIRLASKKDVSVESEATESRLLDFFQLYRETGSRQHFPVRTKNYYLEMWRAFLGKGQGKLLLAYHEQDLLAGVFIIMFGKRAYYQFGASRPLKRELMPTYLLQWQAMQAAQAAGCKQYDMVGLPDTPDRNDPFYGVWKFKEGFGGQPVAFAGAMDWFASANLRTLCTFYEPLAKKVLWKFRHQVLY